MTISYVSSAIYEADTGAMPAHQTGDLIVVFAFRRSDTTLPTIPTRFANGVLQAKPAGSRTNVAAFIIAGSGSETLGTWTNAQFLAVAVYRDSANYITVGSRGDSSSTGTTATYRGLGSTSVGDPKQRSVTASWVGAFIGLNLNSTDGDAAPAGMTNRAALAGAANGEVAIHDSNGIVDWSSSVNTTVSASTAWATMVFEVWDTGIPKSGGGRSAIQALSIPGVSIF